MFPRKSGKPQVELGLAEAPAKRRHADRTLEAVSALALLPSLGDGEFCIECVKLLAGAFGTRYAYIATFADESATRLRTMALYADGGLSKNFTYELRGTPCADVLRHGSVFVGSRVSSLYPADEWMRRFDVAGYFGAAISSASGDRLGIIAVADSRNLVKDPQLQSVLPLYAERIASELGRQRAEDELHLAASVFRHSPQGIMITDADHRIRKVNRAFSAITGWKEQEVIGRRDAMLSAGRDNPDVFLEMQLALDESSMWVGELWSRRRDGEVFPELRTVVAVRGEANQLKHYVSMFSDISAEKFAAERIHRLAHYDATTDLPNRVLLQDRLLHAINRVARNDGRLALLFLDLDGFKLINDTYGHSTGDEVLRLVGERLLSRLRKADVVARIGGDEFAIVLSDTAEISDVQAICDQLLQVIVEPYDINGQENRVTTSIGIAMYPDDGADVQTLLKHADAAMYQAKESGKNCYAFYEAAMNEKAEERLKLTRQLRRALDRDEFSLCYQPQFDLASGRLVGVEALLRWTDENGVAVAPTRFIPVAEDSGLIFSLGAWVLNEACRQAAQWRQQALDFGRMSVNISGRQFQNEDLQAVVSNALDCAGLPASRLELEITESWVMEGPYRAEKQMALLNQMGVSLVIDDFGVANSSMAYLKRFPVQKLKIDRSFIRDTPADIDDAAIVSAIIAMGHSLGLRVVAEGVETPEQSAFLRGTGCDEVQGFLFGRPVPSDEMNVLLLYGPTLSSS